MPYADPERQREYQRKRIAQRRAEWLEGKSCAVCGGTENLQVDHIDGKTKISHRVWSWSAPRREAELAKCQVLCQPHHHEKTKRDWYPMIHGKQNTYSYHGCRCTACTEAHAADVRAWRAQH